LAAQIFGRESGPLRLNIDVSIPQLTLLDARHGVAAVAVPTNRR
jgi:hypothetical protein